MVLLDLADDRQLVIHAMDLRPIFYDLHREVTPMTDEHERYTTRSGRVLSDDDIEALADEAGRAPDLEVLKSRKRGRPLLGSGPAEVVPVRLDPGVAEHLPNQRQPGVGHHLAAQ